MHLNDKSVRWLFLSLFFLKNKNATLSSFKLLNKKSRTANDFMEALNKIR